MKSDYNLWTIYELLGITHKSLQAATVLANKLTKAHNQYWTAQKKNDGSWYATSRFNPIVWKN